MSERRLITGLDVGTSKVCTVIAEVHSSGRLDLVGVGYAPSHGLRKGMVVDLDRTVEAIRDSVGQAERAAGAKVDEVYVGVAGGHITSLNGHGAVAVGRPDWEITRDDVDRAVAAARAVVLPPDRQVIHVLPREFVVDGCRGIHDPVGMSGVRLEAYVHLVTGAVTALRNMVKAVERAGLEVADLVLQPLASAEAVLAPEERAEGVVLIDVGAGTTDLAVFHEGSIWHTAVIPVGGNHVTSDLAYGLRLPWGEAERVKLAYGRPPVLPGFEGPFEAAATRQAECEGRGEARLDPGLVIGARAEEILRLVAAELRQVPHPAFSPGGAVITGGSSQLGGIMEIARQTLEMPVRRGVPLGLLGLSEQAEGPAYATGVGLALYGRRRVTVSGSPVRSRRRGGLTQRVVALVRQWFGDFFPE